MCLIINVTVTFLWEVTESSTSMSLTKRTPTSCCAHVRWEDHVIVTSRTITRRGEMLQKAAPHQKPLKPVWLVQGFNYFEFPAEVSSSLVARVPARMDPLLGHISLVTQFRQLTLALNRGLMRCE